MDANDILLLGDPRLYRVSVPVAGDEFPAMRPVADRLHGALMDFRRLYGVGRAIAAPQVGVMKRLIYMDTGRPVVFINPVLTELSPETMELWDDCMSFPLLLVRLNRHKSCRITFYDLDGREQSMLLVGDLAELLQHEYDHLDGILAIDRAIDGRAFKWRRAPAAAAGISPGMDNKGTFSHPGSG